MSAAGSPPSTRNRARERPETPAPRIAIFKGRERLAGTEGPGRVPGTRPGARAALREEWIGDTLAAVAKVPRLRAIAASLLIFAGARSVSAQSGVLCRKGSSQYEPGV